MGSRNLLSRRINHLKFRIRTRNQKKPQLFYLKGREKVEVKVTVTLLASNLKMVKHQRLSIRMTIKSKTVLKIFIRMNLRNRSISLMMNKIGGRMNLKRV